MACRASKPIKVDISVRISCEPELKCARLSGKALFGNGRDYLCSRRTRWHERNPATRITPLNPKRSRARPAVVVYCPDDPAAVTFWFCFASSSLFCSCEHTGKISTSRIDAVRHSRQRWPRPLPVRSPPPSGQNPPGRAAPQHPTPVPASFSRLLRTTFAVFCSLSAHRP